MCVLVCCLLPLCPVLLLCFLVFLSGVWSGLPCLLVGFVLSFLLWVWRDVLAACLLRRLRTTKDYQPQHHTHTHHSAFLPPVTVGGWFVSVFGIGPFFGCLGCSVASDQAALQRVALARSSGTPCGTARGAREQQRLRTWIVSPFADQRLSGWLTRRESGVLSGFPR